MPEDEKPQECAVVLLGISMPDNATVQSVREKILAEQQKQRLIANRCLLLKNKQSRQYER